MSEPTVDEFDDESNPEEFALAWNSSETPEEVAKKLEMPLPIVLVRAHRYRRMGFHLKKMPRRDAQKLTPERIRELQYFVINLIWEESQSLKEAAKKLRKKPTKLLETVIELRSCGFSLKWMPDERSLNGH